MIIIMSREIFKNDYEINQHVTRKGENKRRMTDAFPGIEIRRIDK